MRTRKSYFLFFF